MAKKDRILEIGIDENSCLYIRPDSEKFPHIYRAACELNWDEKKNVLSTPEPREWSYTQWFEKILFAIKSEYDVALEISENVKWINMPDKIQKEITQITAKSLPDLFR